MALARLLHKIVVCWGDFLLLFAKLLELISRIFSSTIIIRKFLCVKSLNQWHGMVWKRLPWFDLVSIKGVNSKNMFFPNLHVFRINFISKKNPYFLPTPPSVKLICLQLLYLSGMKTHFDQSIFPTHSENWDFSHQMFFSDQWNSAPWRPPIGNRGNRGLEHPFYGRLRCFVDSDELSKFPGKSPTELTAPPYREEWQLFVATLLFTTVMLKSYVTRLLVILLNDM